MFECIEGKTFPNFRKARAACRAAGFKSVPIPPDINDLPDTPVELMLNNKLGGYFLFVWSERAKKMIGIKMSAFRAARNYPYVYIYYDGYSAPANFPRECSTAPFSNLSLRIPNKHYSHDEYY